MTGKSFFWGLAAALWAGLVSTPASADQAMRAQDFVDGVGVNLHMAYTDSSYVRPEAVAAALRFLNISHVRDVVVYPSMQGQAKAAYRQLFAIGIHFNFFVPGNIAESLATMRAIAGEFPGAVASIEGPNEVNNFSIAFEGQSGHAAAVAFQAALYDAVKADPLLKHIPVYNFTDYPQFAGKSDCANGHPYPKDGAQPYPWLEGEIAAQRKVMPGQPVVFTETGYYSLPGPHGWGGVDEATQAKLLVNLLLDAAHLGVKRTYIYQLLDAYPDPKGDDQEKHFGLVDIAYKPKPAARAIRNLLTQLKDQSTDALSFTPGTLDYTIDGLPPHGKSLLLQKADGWKIIIVWDEPDIWDEKAYRPIPISPRPATLTLARAHQTVTLYDPVLGKAGPPPFRNAQSIPFELADTPVLIAVSPQ